MSQIGFDDGTRKLGLETETAENIKVSLVAPEDILSPETFDARG